MVEQKTENLCVGGSTPPPGATWIFRMFSFLSNSFSVIFNKIKGSNSLNEKKVNTVLEEIRNALFDADVPFEVVESFLSEMKIEFENEKKMISSGNQIIKIVHQKILNFLEGGIPFSTPSFVIPSSIMVLGLQGSGKTTTCGKLALWLLSEGKKRGKTRKILLASVDYYRPAAIDQLEILAKSIEVDFYRSPCSDPIEAAVDIKSYFKENGYQYLILDTAGRLHIDDVLMNELVDIEKKIKVTSKLLILDAMTGQESLNVAKGFCEKVGFDFSILTKMDSGTRSGAAFAFRYVLKKGILFVGTGEKLNEFESFIPKRIADRILGMGDILTLAEKAEELVGKENQESMAKRVMGGYFTLKDFADQMSMMSKLGSLQKIMSYMPGVGGGLSGKELEEGENDMKKFKAIISSMTKKELLLPEILDALRKKRIAKGSGVLVEDVNLLIARFNQSKDLVKRMKKNSFLNRYLKK